MAGSKCCYCSFGWFSLVIGLILLIGGLIIQLVVYPPLLISTINEAKVLGLQSDKTLNPFTKAWTDPAYLSYTEFYVFDYANIGGIMNRGTYPDMDEKGPYVYTTKIKNDIHEWSDDGDSVRYNQLLSYTFNAELSCAGCDPIKDTVKIPDLIYQLIVNALPSKEVCDHPTSGSLDEKICSLDGIDNLLDSMSSAGMIFTLLNMEPFINVTVDELLFSGYRTPLVTALKEAEFFLFTFDNNQKNLLELLRNVTEIFSEIPVFYIKNSTHQFDYFAKTGKNDPSKTGYITDFIGVDGVYPDSENGLLPLKWWNASIDDKYCPQSFASQARTLDGTIGDFFQSHLTTRSRIPIYVSDICRTFMLSYHSEVNVKGVDGYRFSLGDEVFNGKDVNNCGFGKTTPRDFHSLPEGSKALPTGYIDLSGCNTIDLGDYGELALPIVASLPHFYQTEDAIKFIPRFDSIFDNDAVTMDIEPLTGTLLKAQNKIQMNLWIGQSKHTTFNSLKVQRSGAYPLFYLNQTALIDQGNLDTLTSSLAPTTYVPIICWSAVGVGAVLTVISLVLFFCSCRGKNEKKE